MVARHELRIFRQMEIREALAYSAAGGIAIHLHFIILDYAKAPACFVRDVEAGRPIAHVFGLDKAKLSAIGREMGVRVIYIDRADTPNQHIDFCGKPLERLLIAAGDKLSNYLRGTEDKPRQKSFL